jgi:hypothetical protein
VWREALNLTWQITYGDDLVKVMTNLATGLTRDPPEAAHPIWSGMLRVLMTHSRPDVHRSLCALLPVLVALGGTEAAGETYRAIQDVARWWP